MYGRLKSEWISSIDLSFFEKAFLTQVCIGAYDLALNFDRPIINITTQAGFRCVIKDEPQYHSNKFAHALRPFLNRDVTSAKWGQSGTLIIVFEGGDEIHLLDETDQFESFTITYAGNTIVV